MFSGAECSHILYVGGAGAGFSGQRDAPLRAVSKLVMMNVSQRGTVFSEYVNEGATDAGVLQ